MFGGDDGLIKRLIGWFYTSMFIILLLLIVAGMLQFYPGKQHQRDTKTCTYTYRTLIGWRWIRINWPELPARCHYGR